MASQKEEPNASILFGDSAGDDPFSQLQQQNTASEMKQELKHTTAKEQNQHVQQNNHVVGDASSLFGDASKGNADVFFSSAAPAQQHQQSQQQQQSHQPSIANASAATFFDQPIQSESFFDGLGQSNQAATSLTQAYDPNAYASYDYNTQSTAQQPEQQVTDDQQAQQYDQSQWIQFDPNTHYYYDEQGQVHYYDPNTNQEYDMSQYGYGQDGQTYDYQYDPQYAEYYAQQGYDPNAYSTEQQAQQQQQYDPNTYSGEQQQTADGSYYDYSNQTYAPVTDAVAEVPAQIQSEQTINTQQYTPQEDYGVQQNYTPADASTEAQQQGFNYTAYESTETQQYSTENAIAPKATAQPSNVVDNSFVQNDSYAPATQLQNEFIAEDLQQQAPPKSFPPPTTSTATTSVPPPPMSTSTITRSALSPPPMSGVSAPPKALSPLPVQTAATNAVPPPPKDIDILSSETAGPPHKSLYDDNAPAQTVVEEEVNLDDLDDLVLGGSENKSNQQLAADEFDHIVSTADYDGGHHPEPIYTNPNSYEEGDKKSEQIVPTGNENVLEPPKKEETLVGTTVSHNEPIAELKQPEPTENEAAQGNGPPKAATLKAGHSEQPVAYNSYEPYQAQQALEPVSHAPAQQNDQAAEQTSTVSQQVEEIIDNSSYAPQQGDQTVDHSSQQTDGNVDYNAYVPQQSKQALDLNVYAPQQGEQALSYEPQQHEQSVNYNSYAPQQGEQSVDYSSYAPQQGEQNVDYSSYAPQQGEQSVDYSSYAPQQGEQNVDYSSYAPQQGEQNVDYSSYAPQQGEQSIDYSSYASQQGEQTVDYSSYVSQQGEQGVDFNSYVPQEGEQAFDYSSYAPQEQTYSVNAAHDQTQEQTSLEPSVSTLNAPKTREAVANYTPAEPIPSAPPQQTVNYSPYAPQEQAESKPSAPPQQNPASQQASVYSQYAPPPRTGSNDQPANLGGPPSRRASNNEQTPNSNLPPPMSGPPKQHTIASPPQRRAVISPPPPANAMYGYPQRNNSITEPDRRPSPLSFGYYNNQFPLERSATVPPPMTERIASPRPQLIPCPDPQCEGENKVKAKFCCECGRPLAGISRSTTPSVTMSPSFGNDTFSPVSASFAPVIERSAVDIKKDAMISSLRTFMAASPLVNADQQLALNYIDSRIAEFDENKALLWKIVRAMIQHQDSVLGDGSELDKSVIALLSAQTNEPSTSLDQLENLLLNGDREIATQYAIDNDMWGHALIISQSNSTEHFKRVISQFIDRELFTSTTELHPQLTSDKKSLRMLYSVFSGAGADAVLELARHSPQDHPIHCAAEQLQSEWKKSLSLVLANRSYEDTNAITGLGNQLQQSGFVHSAYICFILSSSLDSQQIVGAQDTNKYTDLDALYLTELYEYASKSTLDTYKFIQAWWLAELGFANESKIYCGAIVSNNELDKLGDICNTATSESVTSLLNRSTFDTLIGSISNNQGSYDNAADSSYNYGYGGSYTAPADDGSQQPKGIQSPFQITSSVPKTSPFQAAAVPKTSPFQTASVPKTSPFQAASPVGAVRSPFGGYAAPATTDSSAGGWWGSEEQTAAESEDLQQTDAPQQPEYTYQPDAYTPAATAASNTAAYDDDDDDLGFGNTKKKPAKTETETKEAEEPKEQKPNEITSEDKKEQEKGSWGIFSLFGRKEKDSSSDEKKAVKANLGEQSSFYYDEKEKRWVNKNNDTKPAAATPPPPPKVATPKPSSLPAASQPPPSAMSNTPPMSGGPPLGGLKPASTPPSRTSSTPNVLGSLNGGPPSAAPPAFNTPPASRRAGGARKPMRSRYVDVLNTPPPS